MTIGKKLYWGFGAILAVILFLFVINIFTVMRQYTTRSAVASTLSDVQTIESVRYKMIENRLSLGNYLLSGDLRTTSEAIVAGLPVAVPMLEIHTVGAGGGSIARFDAYAAMDNAIGDFQEFIAISSISWTFSDVL